MIKANIESINILAIIKNDAILKFFNLNNFTIKQINAIDIISLKYHGL